MERTRPSVAALGFALAAAACAWNPLSAPFGLVVGAGALVLAIRALRRQAARPLSVGALAVSLAAIVASALVLGLTAGVGRELGGAPVVPAPGLADVDAELDAAAERTRPARERARAELETLEGQEGAPPGGRAERGGQGR